MGPAASKTPVSSLAFLGNTRLATIYQNVLGQRIERLPPVLREFLSREAGGSASGRLTVRRDAGWSRHLVAWALGIPPPGDYEMLVQVIPHGAGQRWVRNFGSHVLTTWQRDWRGILLERKGLASLGFELIVDGDSLLFRACKAWVLGMRVPLWLSPCIDAENRPNASGGWQVRVVFRVPLLGRVAEYQGSVTPIANAG